MQETIDGDLAARVFGLLQVVDTGTHAQRYGEHSRQRLDIAILGFFQGFRKVYIGEQVMHASKVRCKGSLGLKLLPVQGSQLPSFRTALSTRLVCTNRSHPDCLHVRSRCL